MTRVYFGKKFAGPEGWMVAVYEGDKFIGHIYTHGTKTVAQDWHTDQDVERWLGIDVKQGGSVTGYGVHKMKAAVRTAWEKREEHKRTAEVRDAWAAWEKGE